MGICTWTLGISNVAALMEKIRQLGLDVVQYCEPMDVYHASYVKQCADDNGLEIILNDPFDCRPGSKNGEANFNNAISYYKSAIDYAAGLGCGQTIQGLSTWTAGCGSAEEAWCFLVKATQVLSQYASETGVTLSYEPCNLYEVPLIHTAQEFEQLIEDSGCEEIAILLDSFHMNIGETDPIETVKTWANSSSAFHISGNNREGIAQSHIDFKQLHNALSAAGFNGAFVLECVLSGNPVNTPPRNKEEMQRLSEMLIETRDIWLSY